MQKGLIGVIVPVYKVEKYIAECIESILAQTYTNFRLILVDDGTPDNAGKICDEYAKKDPRITVIHQENAGVTRARARGVEEAEDCEWITFVDSDDTIAKSFLEIFHDATSNEVDIVINEGNIFSSYITKQEYLHILISVSHHHCLTPWNKLFRRVLFTKHIFDIPREIIVGEDTLMDVRLVFSSNKDYIATINKDLYNYRQTEDSVIHKHKTTPQYETLYKNVLIKSIPESQISVYILDNIKHRLVRFNTFWGYRYNVSGMKEEQFYKDLENDMKIYDYRLPILERIIFKHENPIIRFIAINIKKVQNLILRIK